MVPSKFRPDNFTLALGAVVIIASVWPCHGVAATTFEWLTKLAIGLLFFLHGARLSRTAITAGATHWRLHSVVFAATFVMFPLLGLAFRPVLKGFLPAGLTDGFLFLCTLPATVQSAIAFTSLARGSVSAAVCSASASSLIGIFLTPLLVGILLPMAPEHAASRWAPIRSIVLQLLVPFFLGHLSRYWIGRWVDRYKKTLGTVDRSSILLVVYTAFSEAIIHGLWQRLHWPALASLSAACTVLLAAALSVTTFIARRLGFSTEDEIAIVFCGSKKSLASGIPMAHVLFADPAVVGPMVLPIMIFHQLQLLVCAILAQRYARRPDGAGN